MASKIAAQLYTVRDFTKTPDDIRQTMAKVAAIGYESVQLSALGPMDPAELRQVCDDNGLSICSTHISFDRMMEDLPGVIADHQAYGCKYPGVGGMSARYTGSADGYREFARDASAVGRKLQEAGMTFVYHNHSQEFQHFGDERGMDILFGESDPVGFQFELDTYWVQHGGASPVAWINKCAGRLPVIHFKVMRIKGDRTQYYCEVGQGNLDWPGIIAACEAAKVEWYIVEQDTCPGDPFDSLKISFDNLKAMGVE
jgi:sugar phosphate isomerase/epimerase